MNNKITFLEFLIIFILLFNLKGIDSMTFKYFSKSQEKEKWKLLVAKKNEMHVLLTRKSNENRKCKPKVWRKSEKQELAH